FDTHGDWYNQKGGNLVGRPLRHFITQSALVFDLPLAVGVERLPARRLTVDLGLHILLLGLATEADHCRITVWVLLRRAQQVVEFRIQLGLVRNQLEHARRTGFTILGELAGGQEQSRGAITQHIRIVDLFALELRHRDRIALGRRRLAAFQQLARVLAVAVGAAKKFAETPGLELHLAAALVAFQAWAFIALDAELALFDLIARAIWIITADVQ